MENIATSVPTANASKASPQNAQNQRNRGNAGLDKVLFDAFVNVDGPNNSGGKGAKKKSPLGELEAEKPAPYTAAPKDIAAKLVSKKPATKEAAPEKQESAPAEATVEEDDKTVTLKLADGTEVEVKPLRVADLLLKNPDTLAKLKKLLKLDDSASDEDVLKFVTAHLRDILEFAGKLRDGGELLGADGSPLAASEPVDISETLLQAVAALMAAQQQKLTEAERKLREGLLELSLIGTDMSGDDAVEAAVARTIDAANAWKNAVAGVRGGDDAIEQAQPYTAQKNDAPAAAENAARAQSNATGGRSDVSLVNNQPSTGQTLPLLPTQLTGGQHRLPVAAQSISNIDIIARPGITLAGSLDAAGKLAKAAAHKPVNLPQVYEQVSVRLNRMAKNGEKTMSLQLNPSELGRVEVKLDFAKDGLVTARIMADSQQTLDLLKHDSKSLERALSDAGLKLDNSSLQFNLRQQGEQANGFKDAMQEQRALWQEAGNGKQLHSEEILINVSPAAIVADGRVDIQV